MSFCACCCHCVAWCVDVCCPRLSGQKKPALAHAGIQYSQVATEDQPDVMEADGKPRITEGRRRSKQRGQLEQETQQSLPRPKMKFVLPQAGSIAGYSVHPQVGGGASLPQTERVLTEQPSPSPDYFKQRFDLSDSQHLAIPPSRPPSSSGESDVSVGHTLIKSPIQYSVPGLPVYREKVVSPLASTSSTAAGGDVPAAINQDPIVQFSLHYDIQQSKLRVNLQYATNLPKSYCKRGSPVQCDTFVMLHLEPEREDTFQSNVVKCTYDPVFNQTFQFQGLSVDNIRLQTLVFRFYNHALNNRAIGKASLQLRDVDLFGVVVQMKILGSEEMEGNFQGDLLVSLSYSPVSRKLAGIISKATGLRKHDMFGKADPYVKVVITYNDAIVYKWKTTVKHKTLAPVYNESFNCKVTEEMSDEMDKLIISFYVIDFDYVLRNDTMGVVNIGKNVNTKLGRRHWYQVLQSPRQRISFWHPIQLATHAQKRHMRSRSPSPLPQ